MSTNISIQKPCNENWSKMSKTANGAFCLSCKVDVIDFSTKSSSEIKSILIEKKSEHTCGKFNNSQIIELEDEFNAWKKQKSMNTQSKFLFACLVVFGMTLFTGCLRQDYNTFKIKSERIVSESISISAIGILNSELSFDTMKPQDTVSDTLKKNKKHNSNPDNKDLKIRKHRGSKKGRYAMTKEFEQFINETI